MLIRTIEDSYDQNIHKIFGMNVSLLPIAMLFFAEKCGFILVFRNFSEFQFCFRYQFEIRPGSATGQGALRPLGAPPRPHFWAEGLHFALCSRGALCPTVDDGRQILNRSRKIKI